MGHAFRESIYCIGYIRYCTPFSFLTGCLERLLRMEISTITGSAADTPGGHAAAREQPRSQRRNVYRGRLPRLRQVGLTASLIETVIS